MISDPEIEEGAFYVVQAWAGLRGRWELDFPSR